MLLLLPLALRAYGAEPLAPTGEGETPFRMGMSTTMLQDVNENDAKAAVRAWSRVLAEQSGVRVAPTPQILSGGEAFARAFRNKELDSATMAIDEYFVVARAVPLTNLLCEVQPLGNEYLLLVPQASGATQLRDLTGKALLVLDNQPSMCLAIRWLDVALARQGQTNAAEFFSQITYKKKLPLVVLPVFFGSAEACLVTQRGLQLMCELNPQVGQRLRILAQSPRFVTGLCCFRADYASPDKQKIVDTLRHFADNPAGRQLLTLFQSGELGGLQESALDSARRLIEEHQGLRENGPSAPGKSSVATGGEK
jgi:phosphonate transport system substrate-binding protein